MQRIVFFLLLCLVASVVTAADNRPNILFIFTDDHAYQAISAYGSNRNVTPNSPCLSRQATYFVLSCFWKLVIRGHGRSSANH